MDTTNVTTATPCNTDGLPCDYCTVSKWAKGDHRAIVPEKWSDITSGEVCNCCLGKNIRKADLDVLLSMAGLLRECLEEEDFRKLTFYEACDMFIDIIDDFECELDNNKIEGNSTTAPHTH